MENSFRQWPRVILTMDKKEIVLMKSVLKLMVNVQKRVLDHLGRKLASAKVTVNAGKKKNVLMKSVLMKMENAWK